MSRYIQNAKKDLHRLTRIKNDLRKLATEVEGGETYPMSLKNQEELTKAIKTVQGYLSTQREFIEINIDEMVASDREEIEQEQRGRDAETVRGINRGDL